MPSDLEWVYMFCLKCENQTDGGAFCSESCRLDEQEYTLPASLTLQRAPSSQCQESRRLRLFLWSRCPILIIYSSRFRQLYHSTQRVTEQAARSMQNFTEQQH